MIVTARDQQGPHRRSRSARAESLSSARISPKLRTRTRVLMYKFTYISRRSRYHTPSLYPSSSPLDHPPLFLSLQNQSTFKRGRLVRRLLKVRASRQSRALPRDTPWRLSQSERLRALPFSFLPILRYIFSRTFSCTSPSSYYILPYLLVKSQPARYAKERERGGERAW